MTSTHFITIKDTMSTYKLGQMYVKEKVRIDRVLKTTVLDRDIMFISVFA